VARFTGELPGKYTHQFEHQGNTYPYDVADVHQKDDTFWERARNFLSRATAPVGSRKAYVYHNAEAAGIKCLDGIERKQLK
jgi:hypothetical protein